MQSIKRLVLGSCLISAVGFGIACRGQLPPTQPPRVVESAPSTGADDGVAAASLAGSEPPSVATLSAGGGGVSWLSGSAGAQSQ